jgi:integrase
MAREITEALLEGLRPRPVGRIEVLDSRVEGLSLRVTSNNVRTWAVRGRLPDGTRKRVTLGKYPEIGIRTARRAAKKALGDIEHGIDRTADKRAAREALRRAVSVAERLVEWQAAKAGGWSARYAAEVKRLCDKLIVPELGAKALTETNRGQWVRLATSLNKRAPGTASWLYSTTSSFLNHAEAVGWIELNPLPRRGRNVIAPHVASRERVLSDDELLRVWRAAEQLSPKTRCFTRLLIMTAARVSEVANIAAGEINHLAGQWTVPSERTKNGIVHTMPLHSLLRRELAAIWPEGRIGRDYRLLGAIKGSGFTAPSKVKAKVDRLSGVTGWRWHDLRRSARTGMARLGVPDRAAEAALNHVSDRSQLTRVYDRHDYVKEALEALETWQAHVVLRLDEQNLLDTASA